MARSGRSVANRRLVEQQHAEWLALTPMDGHDGIVGGIEHEWAVLDRASRRSGADVDGEHVGKALKVGFRVAEVGPGQGVTRA